MKVLLIDPPGWQKHSINLGLSYLAGEIFSENTEVKILDLNNHFYSEADLKNFVENYHPSIIGLSIKTATANISGRIFSDLKRFYPDAVYVAGGPHVTLCAEEFLRENRCIDFGILGDGEISFARLASHIHNNKYDFTGIRGVCYYRDKALIFNRTHLDLEVSQLAFPRFEAIVNMDFSDFRYPLLTSRGCPHGCIFCCVGMISGKKWRPREPESVIKELMDARQRYQINSFEIMDDNFTFDLERAKRICRLLIKEKGSLDWWCHNGLRADKLDEELLFLMKKSGCKSIALGIESGDESVFNNLNKGEKLSDIQRSVKKIQKAGLNCVGYFIVGLPGDSIVSTKKTVRFQMGLKLSDHKYNLLVPYPGTKIWEIVRRGGRMLMDIKETLHFGDHIKASFELDSFSQETIEQCYYLATQQGWVYGEQDLRYIKGIFNSRYGRDAKRILFMGDEELKGASEDIRIEYGSADVIEAQLNDQLESEGRQCFALPRRDGSCFEELCKLSRKEKQLIINTSKQNLFLLSNSNTKEEYIRGEVLPPADKWEKPEGKYYATHLKHASPSIQSARNGVIYKDGIVLSFSPTPEWEKVACGKIESGVAFISLAAYNPSSVYTTDYLTVKALSCPKELTFNGSNPPVEKDNSGSLLELLLSETDCLFIPESLKGFVSIFSKAKMNIVYYKKNNERFALGYEIFDPLTSAGNKRYIINSLRFKFYKKTTPFLSKLRPPYFSIQKVLNVLLLWPHILILILLASLKKTLSRFIKVAI